MPAEMEDAMLLAETGWPPDVLDEQDEERINRFLLYKQVKSTVTSGGELNV